MMQRRNDSGHTGNGTGHAAVIGGGWAGFAAALTLARAGWRVTLHEAARMPGGRARALDLPQPGGGTLRVDNGQHILLGAYTHSLRLMQSVGVDCQQALHRQPLALPYVDGSGVYFSARWPAPLDALLALCRARGWPWRTRAAVLARALRWAAGGFHCAASASVAELCHGLAPQVVTELIEPLCLSALNTPLHEASARMFLRVLRDALLPRGGSHFLLPRCDLGTLFPEPAMRWLRAQGHAVHLGSRVTAIQRQSDATWQVQTDGPKNHAASAPLDAVLLACPAHEAARLVRNAAESITAHSTHRQSWQRWAAQAKALPQRAIATVYAQTTHQAERLPAARPWLALRAAAQQPAQFVFDRGHLGDPPGLMAFVISHCTQSRAALQAHVLAQARAQLGWHGVRLLGTIIEKRATFACLAQLARPCATPGGGLYAGGDYVDGPYPATIEGAVRSGVQAAQGLMAEREERESRH